jgi:hypothetical protein
VAAQSLVCQSNLVTSAIAVRAAVSGPLAAVAVAVGALPRPALGSNPDSSAATGADSPACWPGGSRSCRNTSGRRAFSDRCETPPRSPDSGAAPFFLFPASTHSTTKRAKDAGIAATTLDRSLRPAARTPAAGVPEPERSRVLENRQKKKERGRVSSGVPRRVTFRCPPRSMKRSTSSCRRLL